MKPDKCYVGWHKCNPNAIIPTKRDEDAGFDLYTIEEEIWIEPGCSYMFDTGLQSMFNKNYVGIIKERGSTGKNLLAVRSGVIDSGYRGNWKITIQNLNCYPVYFTKTKNTIENVNGVLYYPTSKAIAQVIFIPLPDYEVVEYEEDLNEYAPSVRGETGWGESRK